MPFFLSRFFLTGHSMEPTLHHGDRVVVESWTYRKRAPQQGEVVAVRHPFFTKRVLIKRIAYCYGDGLYFIVGDNSSDSHDSRHFGAVAREDILGRMWFRY